MASPFNVFRKNQRVLMALLVGFSMIAFIAADVITPQNFPIFLGALLGALALWLLSGKGGAEGWVIAAVGAILGGVIGTYGPTLFRDNAAVYTNSGNLSNEQIEEINRRQMLANNFLQSAYATVMEKAPKDQPPQIPRPAEFGFSGNPVENAVLTYLFQEEADDLGIKLDDTDVTRFIQHSTGGKLTNADLRDIRGQLQVGTGDLVEILREQIRAQDAFRLLVPRDGIARNAAPMPLELWNDFKKLQAEAQVTVATVPVEAFTAEISEPGDDQLEAFFKQYRNNLPGQDGTPGFLVPRQVQLAYVEIPLEQVKKSVAQPTDAEVRAYYEKNRAQFEFSRPPAGSTGTPNSSGASEATPIEAPRPAANATETPASSAAPSTPAPSEGTPAEPAPQENPPAENTPAEETPAEPEAPDQSAFHPNETEFVAFQQDDAPADAAQADAPAAETAAPASAPAEPPTGEPAAPGNAEQPVLPAPTATDSASTKPAEPSQATLEQIRRTLITQRAREAADARLEKVRDDIDRIVEDIMETVPLPDDRRDPEKMAVHEKQRREAAKKVVDRLQDYAKKNGLQFQVTPYMSYDELASSNDYPIGRAVRWEKNAPLFGRETTPVADAIFFQTTPEQSLTTIPAQSLINDSRYVAVKDADVPPRPAELTEKGMREKVVQAWKLREARQLAEDRAKAIADAAKKSGFEAATKDTTVTGKPDGNPVATTTVGPFSWLRRSSAPQSDFAPSQIMPTELPQLPAAGEEFMRTVFNELKAGDVGTAPAQDESAYYVVKVDSKSLESNLPKIREDFMKEEFYHDPLERFLGYPTNPFRVRAMVEANQTLEEWLKKFREQHGVVERPAAES